MADGAGSSAGSSDALGLLSAALNAADSTAEAHNLRLLYDLFRQQPGNLPILLPSLVSLVPRSSPSVKRWIAEVLDLAFCRPTLSSEGRSARECEWHCAGGVQQLRGGCKTDGVS
jgi:symplekin